MVRMKRFAAVAAFTFLFLQVTDSSHASVTVELSAAVTIEELAQNPWKDSWLRAAEMDLPALMAFVDSKSGIRAADLQAVSILATRIFQARKPKGARAAGKEIAKEKYGWGSYQFGCLNTLWTKESHWNFRARNPRTGAYGIPQALPAMKMQIKGEDWRTNPLTQIAWGLHYIDVRYETPCKALKKFKRSRYY